MDFYQRNLGQDGVKHLINGIQNLTDIVFLEINFSQNGIGN